VLGPCGPLALHVRWLIIFNGFLTIVIATAEVRLIITRKESILFIILVDSLIIKLFL
jgi:hypothetical protein